MLTTIKWINSSDNPLEHHLHHFFIANAGLFVTYLIFGSVTPWEVVLFFFMAYLPFADEFFYAVLHYLDEATCRQITHLFIGGEYTETLSLLHKKRLLFSQLIIHNLPVYLGLWALAYVFLLKDMPLAFYGLMGLLTHLMQDIANDQYELKTLKRWFWPVQFFARSAP